MLKTSTTLWHQRRPPSNHNRRQQASQPGLEQRACDRRARAALTLAGMINKLAPLRVQLPRGGQLPVQLRKVLPYTS